MELRRQILEEEFDDTEIESPEKLVKNSEIAKPGNELTTKSFSKFRYNHNSDQLQDFSNESLAEKGRTTSFGKKFQIPSRIIRSPPSLKFDKYSPIKKSSIESEVLGKHSKSIEIDNKHDNIQSPNRINDNYINLLPTNGRTSKPITNKGFKLKNSIGIRVNDSTTRNNEIPTQTSPRHTSSAASGTYNKIFKSTLTKQYPKEEKRGYQTTTKQSILDKVNSTLESLQKDQISSTSKSNNETSKSFGRLEFQEPEFEIEVETRQLNNGKMPPLDVSTPIINRSNATTSDVNNAWWPVSKWLKLKRVVHSPSIGREDAINSSLLMRELGCYDKEELESRYDFMERYRPNKSNQSGNKK
ncbi:uncharacterized protein KGF55_002312 [Candida pseudojiufengensis]|uniref:uncharacterized protein n=1 Tax=Candida pseudojiufengensis TaxID=497109 RepID=UPI00222508D1|nr:uncharacterized protein KGF55_002312 [Candida pseudojiufengensis]KAI5964370.1 hypothetical protein KGF55_002312 [Candida pseudojiufengensis]